jgi:hypothetical protein
LELAPVELHAAGILAALAAAAFAAQCAGGRSALSGLLSAFAGSAFVFARFGSPDVTTLGFCVGAVAVAALARPRWRWLPPLAAGLCGAAWVSVLGAQGLPWLPAAAVAACVMAVAMALAARRHEFVSTELRDEALVLVASFALLLGIGPDVVDGWRSAIALKAQPLAAAGPEVGPWLAALVVFSVLLGGVYTVWKRR